MPKPASGQLILVVQMITAVLVLWSSVAAMLMLGRVHGFGLWRTIANFALGTILLWLLVLPFRTFAFQPFNISSRANQPTLLAGDYIFVSKFSYGYSHYSLPWSPPLFSGRIFASEPERGDIAVFRLPKDDSIDYIFRVIGLPGDGIQM